MMSDMTIRANGYGFTVRTAGPAEGPPVVLLHGFPETGDMWRGLMDRLAAAGYRCVAPDLRGYSAASRPEGVEHYSLDCMVQDVRALARELGLGRFHVVGHDAGGGVAWRLAALYPGEVLSLCALSASHPQSFAEIWNRGEAAPGVVQFQRDILTPGQAESVWSADNFAVLRSFWTAASPLQKAVYLQTFAEPGALTATLNHFRTVAVQYLAPEGPARYTPPVERPALLLWGRRDPMMSEAEIPNNRNHVRGPFETVGLDAGHWLVDEVPDAIASHVLDHLAQWPDAEAPAVDERLALSTLVDVVRWRAQRQPDQPLYTFLVDGERKTKELTFGELHRQAEALAAHLQALDLEGQRVMLLYPSGLDYIVAFFACLYAGVIAVPAYPPDPTRLDRTLPRLEAISKDADVTAILTFSGLRRFSGRLIKRARQLAPLTWIDTQALARKRPPQPWHPPAVGPDDVVFLQYTSGSTDAPKGVMLNHRTLLHHVRLNEQVSQAYEGAPWVSWLPLYHDLGLISCVMGTLYAGVHLIFMSPIAFLQRPMRWLEAISRHRAIGTAAPNFAYGLVARKATAAEIARLDLSQLITASNGAEPILAETLDAFSETFEPCGFRRSMFCPGYGLAEVTATVTGARGVGVEPLVVHLDKAALAKGEVVFASDDPEQSLAYVGLGEVVDVTGHEVLRIVDPETREPCPPHRVGEIWVSSPSVALGYWGRPDVNPDTFGARLADGDGPYLRTGDLGFMFQGQLFVTSRIKDLVIVRGANVHPQDVERTVQGADPAVRPGCVVALGVPVDGSEGLVVVAEVVVPKERLTRGRPWLSGVLHVARARRRDPEALVFDADGVIDAIRTAVVRDHGLACHDVVLIASRSIPKTSSGKLQRQRCKQLYLDDALEVVARRRAAPGEASKVPDTTIFIEDWQARILSRIEAEGSVFPLDMGRPYPVMHVVGRGAAEALYDPRQTDKGAHFGPNPFPENFAVAANGSLFSNGEQHDRLKGWMLGHLRRMASTLRVRDFAALTRDHLNRWTTRPSGFRWNDDLGPLAAEFATLILAGRVWSGATPHIDAFARECLVSSFTGGSSVDMAVVAGAQGPLWDFFRHSAIRLPGDGTEDEAPSVDAIYGQVLGALAFAAYPSTFQTMSSWLGELARAPGILREVRAELDAHRAELEPWLCGERTLIEAAAAGVFGRLPWLTGSLRETMRLHPSVKHVTGYAKTTLTIDGVTVPAGTHLILDQHHSLRSTETPGWSGVDGVPVDAFAPQRYFDDPGPMPAGLEDLIWGMGEGDSGRKCPASQLSPVMLSIFASTLLYEAEWDIPGPVDWDHSHYFWSAWASYDSGLPAESVDPREDAEPLGLEPHPSSRIAVVGGGAAGMQAALTLARAGFPVTLLEKNDTLGGHACVKSVLDGRFERDPAFGVFQANQWPNFLELLETLQVPKISLGVATGWTDSPFWGWFARDGHPIPLHGADADGQRFVQDMSRVYADPAMDGVTVADYLEQQADAYGDTFLAYFFLGRIVHYFAGQPLEYYLGYPIRLVAWMVLSNPEHRSVEVFRVANKHYVAAFEEALISHGVHIVKGLDDVTVETRAAHGVRLGYRTSGATAVETLDAGHLVLAVQPHIALQVLGETADGEEREILGGFTHTEDTVVIHQDPSWLPPEPERRVFNFLLPDADAPLPTAADTVPGTSIGHCNRDLETPIFATYAYDRAHDWQGPCSKFTFSHCAVTPQTQRARQALKGIQGRRATLYCGSWGRGLTFHEDALVTALEAANRVMAEHGGAQQVPILQPELRLPDPFEPLASTQDSPPTAAIRSAPPRPAARSQAELLDTITRQVAQHVLADGEGALDPDTALETLALSSLQMASLAGVVSDHMPEAHRNPERMATLVQAPTLRAMSEDVWALLEGATDATPVPSGQPLRLLALHGFRSNGRVIKAQMDRMLSGVATGGLRVQVTPLEAGHVAQGPPEAELAQGFEGPFYEWITVTRRDHEGPLTLADVWGPGEFEAGGLDASIDRLAEALREADAAGQPYDGLVGFSQGGYMAHLASALARDGDPRFAGRFGFTLIVGRVFLGQWDDGGATGEGRIDLPSCHVYGTNELRSPPEPFIDTAEHYDPQRRVVIEHAQGHVVPRLDEPSAERLRNFLEPFVVTP